MGLALLPDAWLPSKPAGLLRNSPLKRRMIAALAAEGFQAENDNSHHSGSDPRNLCNRGRSGRGVQLELTDGLRRGMFAGLSKPERQKKTDVFGVFVAAIREVLGDLSH